MKNKKGMWLFYLGLAALLLGVAALIVAIVGEFINNALLFKISGIVIAVAGPVAIILLFLKLILYGGAPSPEPTAPKAQVFKNNEKEIKTVDVKEVKKSQEEELYDKYVELYNKNLITKEDLEKKRIELLGK
ncbi:MAG: hypothetical protein KBS97_02415 [Firmicutes bacterium]|nr:hypothetical protein [Candidatus Fiminaster equi]